MTRVGNRTGTPVDRYVEAASAPATVRLPSRGRPDYAADITLVRSALVDATPEARAAFERIVSRLVDLAGDRTA